MCLFDRGHIALQAGAFSRENLSCCALKATRLDPPVALKND
jgi:hypothetical protein